MKNKVIKKVVKKDYPPQSITFIMKLQIASQISQTKEAFLSVFQCAFYIFLCYHSVGK